MPEAVRNTVDRLDKPSAYYLGKVLTEISIILETLLINSAVEQEAQIWS